MRFFFAILGSAAIWFSPLRAQATWDFAAGTGAPATLGPSIFGGTITAANLGAGSLAFNSTSASNHPGASGGNNAALTARTGALSTATSTYIEFTLTAPPDFALTIRAVTLGTRSTSTGPTKLSLYSSADGFTTALASASVAANSNWTGVTLSGFSVSSGTGGALTLRVYGSEGTGSASGANWRIDDLITKADQFISFPAPADRVQGDPPFAITASASSGLVPTFTIVSGPATLLGTLVTVTGTGTVIVRASQGGSTTYTAAPDVDRSFQVTASIASPAITTPPHAQATTSGGGATFTVSATGTGPLRYQWRRGAAPVGSDSPTLILTRVTSADAGDYSVIVTNAAGSVTSTSATLVVNKAAQAIAFDPLPTQTANAAPFSLHATATTGLPVTFTIASGPAVISDNTLTLTGEAGTVTVRASQAGNADYLAAPDVDRSFAVSPTPTAPSFITQPVSASAALGEPVTLAGIARGFPTPTYHWAKDRRPIPGATSSTLRIAHLTVSDVASYELVATNSLGSATSRTVSLNLLKTAQVIVFPPPAEPRPVGTAITLSAVASSGLPVQYSIISGAASISGSRLIGNGPTVAVRASQPGDPLVAAAAPVERTFTFILPSAAPFFTALPADQTVDAGATVAFAAGALGTPPPDFQWHKNGVPIAGATQPVLTIDHVVPHDAAVYSLTVVNGAGTISAKAQLIVREPLAAAAKTAEPAIVSRLTNLSARGFTGPGAATFITGFVVTGAPQRVLARVAGPALAQPTFNVAGTLPDPAFLLMQDGRVVAQNDDWDSPAANGVSVSGVAEQVGAFPFPAGSADAALVTTLAPGAYTLPVTTSGRGTMLAEIYAVPEANEAATARIANFSARGLVRPGEPLIVGFAITGPTSQVILIRGVGPSLARAPFALPEALADPLLTVLHGAVVLRTSRDRRADFEARQIRDANAKAGAFPLDATAEDCALLLTLEPGVYTAQLSGISDRPGVALIEVYEVQP